jgi:hypothetical protein
MHGIVDAVRRALAYFGLDGTPARQDWVYASIETLPPILVAPLVVWLDGVGGLAGTMLGLAYAGFAIVVWGLLVRRLAPWYRR